jgi:uncharacterized membrane protein (DUF373 family)
MVTAKKIKAHYEFTAEEEKILGNLDPLMREHRDRFAQDFYDYILSNEDMAVFFHEQEKLDKHKMLIAAWFMRLFSGNYDEIYFRDLHRIGKIHVEINLDGHFVNSAMTRVRTFITEIIVSHVDQEVQEETILAINKILDINLDVLTSSYRQAELKKYFISARAETALVASMERFTHGLNLVLALALVVVSIGVIALFIHDVLNFFEGGKLETSVVAGLGSLLIIWMMIELLGTEIHHLKGRKIPIKIFIGIVLVAFIRKVLVGSLGHGNLMDDGIRILTLFVLALVYWLISRADRA